MEVCFNHLHFLNADAEYSSAKVVLFGCPFDGTATYQPGSRFAPNAIREASWGLETYSPALARDLSQISFCDLGDLELPFGNTPRILNLINQAVDQILNDRKIPVTLGGEHLITLPIITAFKKYYPDLIVIHLDAHADLRDEYMGEKLSHGTVMRRVLELIGDSNLIQVGIRSGTREEFLLARQIGSQHNIGDLGAVKQKIQGKPVYISLDLDILDTSILPGTGTPEPEGITLTQLRQVLSAFCDAKVAGMDIVELLPLNTPDHVSNIVAAKVVRDSLLLYFTSL